MTKVDIQLMAFKVKNLHNAYNYSPHFYFKLQTSNKWHKENDMTKNTSVWC